MARIVKKPEERRKDIVTAARELFEAGDYKKTTMRDVMDMLGIAKGTIYHYFKSKEELLEAVVEDIIDEDIARREALLEVTPGNALERLRVLLTSSSMADEHGPLLTHLHDPGNVGMHTRLLAVAVERQARLLEGLIRQGCDEGIFETEHPLECAEFLLAGVQFLTDMGIYPWANEDLVRRAMAFPALIEAQLNAAEGSFRFLAEQL
ncbi:MAG: TetR/AcrR family transcriptional regulator [Trueperaceae bacterium]|nr:MAG: TetR/AcrR family transcriptional regulator [Trueperaceae bacterium]